MQAGLPPRSLSAPIRNPSKDQVHGGTWLTFGYEPAGKTTDKTAE